ncbi:MAG: OmpA family protein [Gemmatimonadales bacterium]
MSVRPLIPLSLLLLALAACGRKAEPVVLPEAAPTGTPAANQPPPSNPTPTGEDPAAAAARVHAALVTDLQAQIFFDYDQDVIKQEHLATLDRKAAILNANPAVRIRVSGHADERGSDEYNLVLGNSRALAAKRYLESKGVSGSRIEITSFGEERPADPASSETSWAKNRRDEFEIIAGGDRLVAPR